MLREIINVRKKKHLQNAENLNKTHYQQTKSNPESTKQKKKYIKKCREVTELITNKQIESQKYTMKSKKVNCTLTGETNTIHNRVNKVHNKSTQQKVKVEFYMNKRNKNITTQ